MPGEFMGIGESGFDQILTKRLVGPGGSIAPSCAPELFPVIVLENDRPEWQHLYGGRRLSGTFDVAGGGAGLFSTIRLRNPLTSNCLAVVELMDILVNASTSVTLIRSVDAGELAGGLMTTAHLDFRVVQDGLSGPGSQIVGSFEALAAAPLNALTVWRLASLAANTRTVVNLTGIMLAPGTTLNLRTQTDNIRLAGTFMWRERYLNPTEK